jgi:hypothetical protein
LFVFWYCHKRGRETRLEKERLAAEDAGSAQASGASSINEDSDSIFGEKPKRKPVGSGTPVTPGEEQQRETPREPLIISDGREETPATVNDMPSVSHLPDPKEGKVPEPASPVEKK